MNMQINRLNGWAGLTVASIISAAAVIDQGHWKNLGHKGSFALACCLVSSCVGLLFLAGNAISSLSPMLVGTAFELVLSVCLLGLWCGGIAIIQDPTNALATFTGLNKSNDILNANMYFFSWSSFASAVYLAASNLQDSSAFHVVDRIANAPKRLVRWYLLLSASIVVLVTAADLKEAACSDDCYTGVEGCYSAKTCRTTKFAISIGSIFGTFSLLCIILTHMHKLSFHMEAGFAILSFIFYCFGVGFITSDSGPGSSLGNLYFATWGGFIFSTMLIVMCASEYLYDPASEDNNNVESPVQQAVEVDEEVPRDDGGVEPKISDPEL